MLVLVVVILVILFLAASRVRLTPDKRGRLKVSRKKNRRKGSRMVTRAGNITPDRICPECGKPESLCARDQRRANKFL
jgi:hypothetical protein